MRMVDITPDKSLLEKLGSVGFVPEEAVAEFVDNALDAKYEEETGDEIIAGKIHVNVNLTPTSILVSDDSAGISDFDNCLRAAWSTKELDVFLGSYGLGLKTAAMSLGKKLKITSVRIGEGTQHRAVLDLDRWYEDPTWRIEVEDLPAKPSEHGTTIEIERLHVNPELFREDLAR